MHIYVQMSSDAWSNFGKVDCETHNGEVDEAYRHLLLSVIPDFAAYVIDSVQYLGTHVRSLFLCFVLYEG